MRSAVDRSAWRAAIGMHLVGEHPAGRGKRCDQRRFQIQGERRGEGVTQHHPGWCLQLAQQQLAIVRRQHFAVRSRCRSGSPGQFPSGSRDGRWRIRRSIG